MVELGEVGSQQGGDLLDRGDADQAAQVLVAPEDVPVQREDVVFDARGDLEHLLANRRERVSLGQAIEQAGAEALLERADAAEHGRVVDR